MNSRRGAAGIPVLPDEQRGGNMQDFQHHKARLIMTLRGMGIVSPDVLSAIERVPREMFVPPALRDHAYENASLPIAMEQTISQPYIVARMTAALQLTGRERVLEIGTGSGYQAAILSYLCRRVYSIERLRPLLVEAENRFRKLRITNITSKFGDGAGGWPEGAPFDRIILTCAPAEIPATLLNQVKTGGIMVAPEGRGREQSLVVIRRTEDGFDREEILPVKFVPLVEG